MEFVGLTKLSLVDFDHHMSCTLFTQGCNFRCPFCHNSSLVISNDNPSIEFDYILSYLRKRKGILDAVVITGGEPTLMQGLEDKLRQIKELGYLIKLDTNGSNPNVLIDLVNKKLVDYVAMDIKSSFEKYPLVTNSKVNIENIKKSVNFLIHNGVDYEFRTTLVKEFNDKEDIVKMANDIDGAKKIRLQLFVDSGHCISPGLTEVDSKTANDYCEILKNHVSDVALRGYKIL